MAPRTLTYVLAVSVYCTAWTFHASVGLAANRGLEFLTIYLGPALVALMWPSVLRGTPGQGCPEARHNCRTRRPAMPTISPAMAVTPTSRLPRIQ